ncbi:MAG: DMT family transporter [Thermoplasmatota archaeon]
MGQSAKWLRRVRRHDDRGAHPRRGRLDHVDALMVLLVLIWGTAFPVIPLLERFLDPFQLTWYRYLPFPLVYGAYILLRRRAILAQVTGRDWLAMAALGFVGVVGYHFSLNWAMSDAGGTAVTAATGAILVATTPLWTLILSLVLGRERLRPLAAAGSLVAFAGVVLVVLKGQGEAHLTLAAKAAIAMVAPLSWALYSVFTKPLITKYGGVVVTGVTLSLGTATLVPLGVRYGFAPLARLGPVEWGWLAFLALLSTALGYAIWNYAIRERSASSVTTYIYLNPVVATVMGAWVLPYVGSGFPRAAVTGWFLAGGALVLAGLALVHRARMQAPTAAAAVTPAEAEGTRP